MHCQSGPIQNLHTYLLFHQVNGADDELIVVYSAHRICLEQLPYDIVIADPWHRLDQRLLYRHSSSCFVDQLYIG